MYLAYSVYNELFKVKIGKSTGTRNGTYKGSKNVLGQEE
jgi:hypothetical protein